MSQKGKRLTFTASSLTKIEKHTEIAKSGTRYEPTDQIAGLVTLPSWKKKKKIESVTSVRSAHVKCMSPTSIQRKSI